MATSSSPPLRPWMNMQDHSRRPDVAAAAMATQSLTLNRPDMGISANGDIYSPQRNVVPSAASSVRREQNNKQLGPLDTTADFRGSSTALDEPFSSISTATTLATYSPRSTNVSLPLSPASPFQSSKTFIDNRQSASVKETATSGSAPMPITLPRLTATSPDTKGFATTPSPTLTYRETNGTTPRPILSSTSSVQRRPDRLPVLQLDSSKGNGLWPGTNDTLQSPCFFHQRFDDAVDVHKVLEEIAGDEWMSHSRLMQTATGVREVSKQLQRRPIKRAVKNVMIVTKARDNHLITLTRELAEWLMKTPRYSSDLGVNVYVDEKLRHSRRFDAAGLLEVEPRFQQMLRYWTPDLCWEQPERFDLVLTLGGDGTVLFTSWLFQRVVPPILSFSLGSLGFLTNFEFPCYKQDLDRIMGSEGMRVNLRMRFTCTVHRLRADGTSAAGEQFQVLNELVIDRGPSPYVSNLELYGDNELLTVVQADGCIFSTPTGSTAYSLSAGGSLVHPDIPAILLTPICPHTLSFRPMLLTDTMLFRVSVPRQSRATAYCSFDGKGRVELRQGDSVTIAASQYPFPTVSSQPTEWFNSVSRTLRWNTRAAQQKAWDGENADADGETYDIDTIDPLTAAGVIHRRHLKPQSSLQSIRHTIVRANASALPQIALSSLKQRHFLTIAAAPRTIENSRRILTIKSRAQKRWASEDATVVSKAPVTEKRPAAQEQEQEAQTTPSEPAAHATTPAPAPIDQHTSTPANSESQIEQTSLNITEPAELTPQSSNAAASTDAAAAAAAAPTAPSSSTSEEGVQDTASEVTSPGGVAKEGFRTLWIGNLPFRMSVDELKEIVNAIAPTTYARILKDTYGRSRGFAYVDFETHEEAQKVKHALINRKIHDRVVQVNFSRGPQALPTKDKPLQTVNPPSKVLFIGNIPYDASDKDLNALFRPVKNAIEFRVAIDRQTGHPRGFCHAEFIDTPSAKEAFEYFSAKSLHGRQLKVDYTHQRGRAGSNRQLNPTRDIGPGKSDATQE
ncbi:ATP-NAD kinase [Xylona heveae TC161]|uniref:ATP-NAD kinase n=1 Tax=Xylona heveae (strain CBS 132557 / TC161) TaxID=1328760 RepID=A0A165HKY3_XYLHT|nr:ATP-NAD kinase [Xylona heveae TC161]KZF23670.1 ATP-NAD kinase [Xylona heveae TC161]